MSRLETKIETLQRLSNDEWEALLTLSNHVPHPGYFIIVPDRMEDRKAYIERRLEAGMKRADIARELQISPGLITKILNGSRR